MNKKITVIGSLNYDVILKIPRLPFKGETLTANGAAFSAGGKGANQAVQAAKLKTPTYMVGCVGTDASADFLVNTAKEYGVNVDYIRKVPGSSGMGVINAVEDGSVYACIVRGANFEVTKEDVDNAMPILKESGVCILQNEIPVEIIAYAIDKAKEAGCIVVLNAAPAIELPEECLSKVDILVVNEVEAEFYCHEKIDSVEKAKTEIKKMAEKYNNNVIFTLGKDGAVAYENGTIEFIPAMKVDAIETTGAGDSYIGSFLYQVAQTVNTLEELVQLDEVKVTEIMTFSAATAALTVSKKGAIAALPTKEAVIEMMNR